MVWFRIGRRRLSRFLLDRLSLFTCRSFGNTMRDLSFLNCLYRHFALNWISLFFGTVVSVVFVLRLAHRGDTFGQTGFSESYPQFPLYQANAEVLVSEENSKIPRPNIDDAEPIDMGSIDGRSCMEVASKIPEPYTSAYRNQTIDLHGTVYAFHTWDQPIEKHHIATQRSADGADCRVIFKVKNRSLFVYQHNRCYQRITAGTNSAKTRYELAKELILLALEIYDVPDVDFVLELEDSYPGQDNDEALPVLCYSLNMQTAGNKGFTYPSYGAYQHSLGQQQMLSYRECLKQRYPFNERIPKAIWRGSSTGCAYLTIPDVYENRRISLAHLGLLEPEVLDVGITDYVQVETDDPEVMNALRKQAPLREQVPMEDFNLFGAIIDLDGNAWSDRFALLLSFNTPLLKQEYTGWREYFAHLVGENSVTFFKQDLSDLVVKAKELVDPDRERMAELMGQLDHSFQFAMEHLSHVGVIRGMAYSMAMYASFLTWDVEMEDGYVLIPSNTCCHNNPSLPKELIERMQAKSH